MSWQDVSLEAYARFTEIEAADLVAALRYRFDAEHISKYFNSTDYSFDGTELTIRAENSILIEFSTLQAEYPDLYPTKQYRLLLLLALHGADSITPNLSLELNTVRRQDNIDRVVLWSCAQHDATKLFSLKGSSIDVITITERDVGTTSSLSHYAPVAGKDHDYALALNLAADLLLKRLKKMFHLVLSEVAAPIYDRQYGKQKVATEEMMRYEEKLVRDVVHRWLPESSDRRLAVDVGCGTGRHTFPLVKQFDRIVAFDFSPRMISEAVRRKGADDIRNVLFSVADLEYETIRDEALLQTNGRGQVDLIVASFGLGSFVEDTAGMMRRFHGWLRDGGIVILSFYNRQTILLEVTPNWRDTALSAHFDTDTDTLRVELSPKTVFHIYCRPYSMEIQNIIADSFEIMQVSTFPTLMALMPNSLLQSAKALGIFRFVDETLAEHKDYKFGHYVTLVVRKRRVAESQAYERILAMLMEQNAAHSFIKHPRVISTEEVRQYVDTSDGVPVKTLLFRKPDDRDVIVAVVPARLRIDTATLARRVGVRKLLFASDRDVLATGFPLGGLAPFGFLPGTVSRYFIDRSLLSGSVDWLYMGSGDSGKTLRIKRDDFLAIVAAYEPIDA